MFYNLTRHLYWPSLAVDCYETARNCIHCAKERVKLQRKTKRLKLFPATAPLELLSIDLLGQLIRTPRGNRWLLVITDCFSKLVRTVALKRITAAEIAKAFVHHWVFVYGTPVSVLADNGKQFVSRLFQEICRILGIKNVFTTTYNPQTNGQVERFNRTMLAVLRHYVAEHPKDWYLFTDALTYAYNTQTHSTTKLSPFELVLSRPPRALSLQAEPQLEKVGNAKYHAKWRVWLRGLMSTATVESKKSQERYRANYDKHIRASNEDYRPGTYIFVRRDYANPRTEARHKLAPVANGPYRIVSADQDTVDIQDGDDQERVTRDRIVPAPVQLSQPVTPSTTSIHDKNRVHSPDRPGSRGGTVPHSSIEPPQTHPRGLADLPEKTSINGAVPTGIWNRARIGQPPPSRRSDGTTKSRPECCRNEARRYARLANENPVVQEKNSIKELDTGERIPPADSPRDEPTPVSNEGEGDARRQLAPEAAAQNAPVVMEQHRSDPREAASNTTLRQVSRNQSLSPHAIDEEEYVVDHVVAHRYDDDDKLVFPVRWYGYTPEEDTE